MSEFDRTLIADETGQGVKEVHDMEKDVIVPAGKDITIVVSRNVFPGRENDYAEWVRQLVAAASEAPGNMGITTLIPQKGQTGLYHVVLRFKDQASVDTWENSAVRQRLSGVADQFSRSHRQAATGLETWFTIPECPSWTHRRTGNRLSSLPSAFT